MMQRILRSLRHLDLVLWVIAAWFAGARSGRVELSLTLAILALVVLLPRRLPGIDESLRTRLLLGLALACLTQAAGPDLVRFAGTSWVRSWNVYHYSLGAEYFGELGYHDLYRASLIADAEGEGHWRGIERVRDLETYRVEPRDEELQGYRPEEHFSGPRWADFRRDVAVLARGMEPSDWRGVFTDRGYNATPFWSAMGKALTTLLPIDSPVRFKLLLSLDLLVLAFAIVLVGRTFGLRTAALVLLLFTLTPVNNGRLVGGFLQYDWFSSVALGLCFYHRKQPTAAGLAFAYAALARIFPGLFVVAGVLPLAFAWWRRQRRPSGFERRFLAVFVLAGLVGVGIGSLTPRGPGAWLEFANVIHHHAEHHVVGERRIGLEHLFTRDLGAALEQTSLDQRRGALDGREWWVRLSSLGLIALWGMVVIRRRVPDAQLLGLVPFFALAVSSRYYWSLLALLPMLGLEARTAQPHVTAEKSSLDEEPGSAFERRLSAAQVGIFAVYYAFFRQTPDRYAAYWWLNALLLAFFVGLLSVYRALDARSSA